MIKKAALLAIFLLLVILYQIVIPVNITKTNQTIYIPKGAYFNQIKESLAQQGIIRNKTVFHSLVKIMGKERKIKAGMITIPPYSSLITVIHQLTSHNLSQLVKVTVPEGYQIKEIAALLAKKINISESEFISFTTKKAKYYFQDQYPFLTNIPSQSIEGYLYPETYFLSYEMSVIQVVQVMIQECIDQLYPVWQASPQTQLDFHDSLTLASIVEKEAAHIQEMPLIASVFYNRIKKRMYLSSDPTVLYAMGLTHKEVLYYKDLKIESPYNTYQRFGLPPTPIASPGKQALLATLNPKKSAYLFFVAKRDGTHYFSKTYKEHLEIQKKKNYGY